MTTLKDLIVAQKCRTGRADGTTKHGAYWLACERIKLRRCGGDGIGNNDPDITFTLVLRHYRSGEVQASVHRNAYHQNGSYSGGGDRWESVPAVLDCQTVEEVIVALKAARFGESDYSEAIYSDRQEDEVAAAMEALGMPLAATSPDEAETEAGNAS